MKLYFFTSNKGKMIVANSILKEFGIEVIQKKDDSIVEPCDADPKNVVKSKALQAIQKYQCPLICEDSGFFIPSLNNFPGTLVDNVLQTLGLENLLSLLHGKNRYCYFQAVLAYMEPRFKEPMFFEEKIEGDLSKIPRGKLKPYSWSELHLVFIPKGESKTLGEMTEKEYNSFRNRESSRFVRLGKWLSSRGS